MRRRILKMTKLKDVKKAIEVLKTTIEIRENTRDLFDIQDDIEVLNKAIYCLEQDIFYDCYDD